MSIAAALPPYVAGIEHVLVDAGVVDTPLTGRVRSLLPAASWTIVTADEPVDSDSVAACVPTAPASGATLYLKHYKGRFLRFCPGTRYYRCCAYRIIHIGENCPLGCSYCILQAYFQDRVLKVWANQSDLWSELERAFGADRTLRYRVGTGEFTDSLVLESLTGYSRDLVAFLAGFDNVCLELKSKVVDLSWQSAVGRPDRVLPAWSLNAPRIVAGQEPGAASLESRLAAARDCASAGFRVCLHFDPIIRYAGWDSDVDGYGATVQMIFDYLRPEQIAYVSLGSFRFMPRLKATIAALHPEARYIYEEYVTGLDGKQRLLRPLRVEQFRFLVQRLRRYGLDRQLYFCMESDEVWDAVLGYTPRTLGGLAAHLMRQAFGD